MKALYIAGIALLLSACDSSSNSEQTSTGNTVSLNLQDKFQQANTTFSQGDTIKLELEFDNNGSEVTLNFTTSQQYDFYIQSASGEEIWRWSDGKTFTQSATSLTIPANEISAYEESWDQKLTDNSTIPVGSYTVYASFMDQSDTATSSLTIQ